MKTYTIMPGDTMWKIATKHGVGLDKLLTANPQITNPNLIFTGQIINIPSANTSTYTIILGDTMWHIATKHGIGFFQVRQSIFPVLLALQVHLAFPVLLMT